MNKYILLGIILVSPLIILFELYIISLLIEAIEIVIGELADLINNIKDKFGKWGNKSMKIRLPRIIGRKLYFKCRKWEIRQQFTIKPFIRIESEFYTYPMKTRNYSNRRW